jgi:hypothetical protein
MLTNSPDWTVQKGRAQSHCHELYPSDAKNHFVLEQEVAKYYLQVLRLLLSTEIKVSKIRSQFLVEIMILF